MNAAAREVVMALPNMTSSMADRIVEFRETAELRGQQDVIAIIGDVFRDHRSICWLYRVEYVYY